jgi:hypothetical protein
MEEKRIFRKKERKYNEYKLRDQEHRSSIIESRTFYQEIKSRNDFKPRAPLCRDINGAVVSGKEMIIRR